MSICCILRLSKAQLAIVHDHDGDVAKVQHLPVPSEECQASLMQLLLLGVLLHAAAAASVAVSARGN